MSDHPKVAETDHNQLVEGRAIVDSGTQEPKRHTAAGSVAASRRTRSSFGTHRLRCCRMDDAALAGVPYMRGSSSGDGFCR